MGHERVFVFCVLQTDSHLRGVNMFLYCANLTLETRVVWRRMQSFSTGVGCLFFYQETYPVNENSSDTEEVY